MPHIFLRTALSEFDGELKLVEKFATSAQQWAAFSYPPGVPRFAPNHRDMFVEMAFLNAFQSWEIFLEETFTLYLLGKRPPKGRRLHGQVPVRTRYHARKLLLRGKPYLDWSPCHHIYDHNKAMFKNPKNTYFHTLVTVESMLNEIADIRNAIAHGSGHSWDTFKTIVRDKLTGAYPANLSVGGFLITIVPGTSPPETFLDDYLDKLRLAAGLVVPV